MAGKRDKHRSGMESVGRVALVVVVAYVLLVLFYDPDANPLYVSGRGNFRRASCASNMKQLGLGMVQYSQDYDSTLPHAAAANGYGWREAIYPYTKSTGLYQCPDDARGRNNEYTPDNLPKSYGANAAVVMGGNTTAISDPIQTITVADMRGYSGEEWNMVSPAFLPKSGRKLYAHVPRHIFYDHPDGVLNLLFADGHVKGMKPAATLAPVNLWTLDNKPFVGQDLVNAQAIMKRAESE